MDSAKLSIDKAPKRLNMSRERQKVILKREQETAIKKVRAGRNVIAILPAGFGKSKKLRITLDCSISKEIVMLFL